MIIMGPMLRITTTPIKLEMQIKHARLEYQQEHIPQVDITQKPAHLETHTENVQIRMDSYEMRKSLGLKNSADLVKSSAERGMKNIQEVTRNYVETGKQLAQIQNGTTIGDIIWQKTLEQPQMYTVFLPSARTEISWQPNDIQFDYTPGDIRFDWKRLSSSMDYIPGEVRVSILQYPDVEIEYIGKPFYVPPSASPDYESTE